MVRIVVRVFVLLAMVVVMTVAPQTASAGTCGSTTVSNVTPSQWQCAEEYINDKLPFGIKIEGDSGKVGALTCDAKYNYNPSSETVNFSIKSGWACPVSCGTINSNLDQYINSAKQKCGIKG